MTFGFLKITTFSSNDLHRSCYIAQKSGNLKKKVIIFLAVTCNAARDPWQLSTIRLLHGSIYSILGKSLNEY